MTEETVAPETVNDIPDACELLDSGRVRLTVDGKTITLREPKVGDLKAIKRGYFTTAEKLTGTTGKDLGGEDLDAWIGWLRDAVNLLGDGKLPTGKALDRLPAPWGTLGFAVRLINHWQSVPLPSGA